MIRALPALPLAVLLVVTPARAAAGRDCSLACLSARCRLAAGRCLVESKRHDAAKKLLKAAVAQHPGDVGLRLLLVKAYMKLGNMPWTRRVLARAAESFPKSCEVRAWQIWFHLRQAELGEAQLLLREKGCPDSSAARGRWALLQALHARYAKRPAEARAAVDRAFAAPELFPEDRELLDSLRAAVYPEERAPLHLRLDLGAGYTANGLMGSPADLAATGRATASPLLFVDGRLAFAPRWGTTVRPLLELGLRSIALTADPVADYTYLSLDLRPGLRVRELRLYYSGQLFLLHGGDAYSGGPRWFYETHRAELEWEPTRWLTLFGGGGKSIFREQIRSRTEADGGAAALLRLGRSRLLAALSLRTHEATHEAYDLWGGTLVASLTYPVGPLSLRARFLLSFDIYQRSKGFFAADEARRDLLLKGTAEVWSPQWHGIRGGLVYEPSDRLSTAGSYAYVDHRVQGRLSLSLDLDPWAPRALPPAPAHIALPYERERRRGLEEERIQDLLRQEDAARRGSSCLN